MINKCVKICNTREDIQKQRYC